jgi:hypothetical protein
MHLVLCETSDISALWAYHGLKTRGLKPIKLVSSEMLAYSLRLVQRIGTAQTSIELTLSDGSIISGENTGGVLNRIQMVPSAHLKASPADREYATQELFAFMLGWMHSLPGPVINPPAPQGLCGRWRHISEWILMAHAAGLSTPIFQMNSSNEVNPAHIRGSIVPIGTTVQTVIVLADHVFGAVAPPEVSEGCRHLAESARTPMLGVEFASGPERDWTFTGATPLPDLIPGGEKLLDALAELLSCAPEVSF